jgi:aminopeptidase
MGASKPELVSATRILRDCLQLADGQNLTIIFDESTVEVAAVLTEAADQEGIPYNSFLVPVAVQRRIPHQTDLSLTLQGAAHDARAILTCVNAHPDCLPFRNRILETTWSARTRIGHMPGAALAVLNLANVDMAQLAADCHLLEEALARGHQLELHSHTAAGEQHTLQAGIGGWSRLPVASDGIIGDGVWGNVPSGETYISPLEGTAQGTVVINGSVPGLVIPHEEEIVLYFDDGCLARIVPPDNAAARWLESTQLAKVRSTGDSSWTNLAEIGIGVNVAVTTLTGNMLFDEKAAGTAHIAIGDNTYMGGTVRADIHCDMVILDPTITIDGQTIVNAGRLERDFDLGDYASVDLAHSPLNRAQFVTRSGTEAVFAGGDRLQRQLRSDPGRVSACRVGSDDTSRRAGQLYHCLPEPNEWLSIAMLARQAHMPVDAVRSLLSIMFDYELIKYS